MSSHESPFGPITANNRPRTQLSLIVRAVFTLIFRVLWSAAKLDPAGGVVVVHPMVATTEHRLMIALKKRGGIESTFPFFT